MSCVLIPDEKGVDAEMHDQWALSGLAQRLTLKAGENVRNSRLKRTHSNSRVLRQIVLGVIGGTITLIGVALLVLPGPAILVLPIGLAILGAEFAWARRLLRRFRDSIS
jgi:hypothetical protein